jgi:hypothetical protein
VTEVEDGPGRSYCQPVIRVLRCRTSWVVLAAVLVCTFTGSLANANAGPQKVFYLQLKVGQCALRPHSKILLVVSCSNPKHSLETYAVMHGGWGRTLPSHSALVSLATSMCRSSFQRRFGHPIRTGYGFEFFFPDPGAETRKYGDRVICSLRTWPSYGTLGAGKHFG